MTVDAKASQPIDELRQSAALVLTAAGTHSSPELEVKPDQLELQERERQQSPVPSLGSSRNVCRICHMDSRTKEPLISPCRCKGTLAYVHLSCLERWLNQSCRNYCELCNFRYNALETRRYRWYEGLRIWINHPRNRRNFRDDILIFLLLTAFTVGVSTVCLLGYRNSHYFMQEGERIGFSRAWTKPAITIFMFIIMLGYCAVAYPLIRNQAAPWYRWWRDAVIIRLTPGDYSPSNMESEIQYQQHQQNDLADERR